jgi:hypothetical protein
MQNHVIQPSEGGLVLRFDPAASHHERRAGAAAAGPVPRKLKKENTEG